MHPSAIRMEMPIEDDELGDLLIRCILGKYLDPRKVGVNHDKGSLAICL